jgi:hypothetical protein
MNQLTLVEAQALQERIERDIEGTDITCAINAATDTLWCAVWHKGELLFTVSSLQQWDSIFNAFRLIFSGPSEATILLMLADSEDCIF